MRGLAVVLGLALLAGACRSGDVAGNTARTGLGFAGVRSGRATDVIAASVTSLVDVTQQISTKFSPEQEYYLGRAVAANVIAQYGLDPDEERQAYVRRIGATLVTLSERVRTTHGGYHFAVLNTPTINGLSGPGGYVFLTRGAVDACANEDEVAALIAHEIAHVSLMHGEAVVRGMADFQTGVGALGRIVGAAAGGGEFERQMSQVFSVAASGLSKTLVDQGYGSALEFKADTEAVYVLWESRYDANALANYLKRRAGTGPGAWAAHPESGDRAKAVAGILATYGSRNDPAGNAPRKARFEAATGRAAPAEKPAGESAPGSAPPISRWTPLLEVMDFWRKATAAR